MKIRLKLLLYISTIIVLSINTKLQAQGSDSSHFTPVWQNNPFQPMTIIVSEATINTLNLEDGDEIGVFDVDANGNKICVGSVVIEDSLTASNPAIVTASADDPTTPNVQDGFIDGHDIIFKLWDSDQLTETDSVEVTYDPNYNDNYTALGTALVTLTSTLIPSQYTVTSDTLQNGQSECYNATSILTVSDTGNSVVVESGAEVTFIAGEKIYLKPGFSSRSGSYTHAYITITGDYCSNQQSMVSTTNSNTGEDVLYVANITSEQIIKNVNIYPNPTTGNLTVDFLGEETTATIRVINFQGGIVLETKINHQLTKKLDLRFLPEGMYVLVINTKGQQITKKIIKNY